MAKPRMRPYAQTATFEQMLVFFDGPQVALFRSDRGLHTVGVSVGDPDEAFYPLLMTEVLDITWRRYVSEKVDLRFLYRDGSKKLYFANWAELESDRLKLTLIKGNAVEEQLLPAAGFWARNQTVPFKSKAPAADTLSSYAIDGSWDASDFSRFYGRAADLYAYLIISASGAASNLSAGALEAIRNAIRTQSFRGGGSYVGFYDRIFSKVDEFSPLRVRRIAYASPGNIDLEGSGEALADVARVVESFGGDEGAIGASYKFIDETLRQQELKTASPSARFANPSSETAVLEAALSLNRSLGVDDPTQLFDLCDRNVLVFAKVSLSFYRRARDLYAFHAEGRVAVSEVAA